MGNDIGTQLSPILEEIEHKLWENDNLNLGAATYTDSAFRAATKIFMSVISTRMWELQEKEDLDMDTRCHMAERLGKSLKDLVKVYTDIDTHKLYDNG